MAEQQHQPASEIQRIRATAAHIRVRAIRSQIAIGLTFCNIAELEIENGRVIDAQIVIEKLRRLTETMRRHLNEPNHVPSNEVEKTRTQIAQLESAILAVEERARQSGQ